MKIRKIASRGIEDGSIHAQLLQLHLLGGTGARPRHLPSLCKEALRDVAADEAGAQHEHVPRLLRLRGHQRRRRLGGDSWSHRGWGLWRWGLIGILFSLTVETTNVQVVLSLYSNSQQAFQVQTLATATATNVRINYRYRRLNGTAELHRLHNSCNDLSSNLNLNHEENYGMEGVVSILR